MQILDDLRGVDWLVAARNEIQSLMLELYHQRGVGVAEIDKDRSRRWQICVGAAVSLWRAVYLAQPGDVDRPIVVAATSSVQFLEDVITTNAVAQSESKQREWATSYYINNARMRLADVRSEPFEWFRAGDTLRAKWNEYLRMLQDESRTGFPAHSSQQ